MKELGRLVRLFPGALVIDTEQSRPEPGITEEFEQLGLFETPTTEKRNNDDT